MQFPRANDPAWLKAAFADLHVKELPGPQHNARVLEMFRKAGHPQVKDDETAWCSAAANTWMLEGGLRGTGSLAARSWLNWGKKLPTDRKIPRGAVVIFKRGNSSWQGHVAFCLEDEGPGGRILVLGGNQSNSVNASYYNRASLLGARWPNTVGNSRTIKAGVTSAISGAGAEATDQIQPLLDTAQGSLLPISEYLTIAKYALVAVSLIALGYMIWLHLKRLRAPTEPSLPEFDDEVAG